MSSEGNRLEFLEERVSQLEETVAELAKWTKFNQQENIKENHGRSGGPEVNVDGVAAECVQNNRNEQEGDEEMDIVSKVEVTMDANDDEQMNNGIDDPQVTSDKPCLAAPIPDSTGLAQKQTEESRSKKSSSSFGYTPFVPLKRTSASDKIPSTNNNMTVKQKPEWKCPHCPNLLSCKNSLERHIRIHTGERPFRCPHCQYAASRKDDLQRHIRRMHPEELKHFNQLIKENNANVGSVGEVATSGLGDESTENLNRGDRRGEGEFEEEIEIACKVEVKHGNDDQQINNDVANQGPNAEGTILPIKTQQDEICQFKVEHGSNSSKEETASSSKQSKNSTTAVKSSSASTSAETPSTKNKIKVKAKPQLKCPDCPKIYTCKYQLSLHIRSHTGERPFFCPHCPKTWPGAAYLWTHIRKVHPEEDQNLIQCRICQNKFPSRKILLMHMKKHLECYFCSLNVKKLQYLRCHLATHTGEKHFSCPHCPYATSHEGTLKKHENTHKIK